MKKNNYIKNDIYKVESNKTIPILEPFKSELPSENNLFDEEITISTNGLYDDNRIRIIIYQEDDIINIFTASFEGELGLCHAGFSITKEEYEKFPSICKFIEKAFIEGVYSEYGASMTTHLSKEKFQEKDITDDL